LVCREFFGGVGGAVEGAAGVAFESGAGEFDEVGQERVLGCVGDAEAGFDDGDLGQWSVGGVPMRASHGLGYP